MKNIQQFKSKVHRYILYVTCLTSLTRLTLSRLDVCFNAAFLPAEGVSPAQAETEAQRQGAAHRPQRRTGRWRGAAVPRAQLYGVSAARLQILFRGLRHEARCQVRTGAQVCTQAL